MGTTSHRLNFCARRPGANARRGRCYRLPTGARTIPQRGSGAARRSQSCCAAAAPWRACSIARAEPGSPTARRAQSWPALRLVGRWRSTRSNLSTPKAAMCAPRCAKPAGQPAFAVCGLGVKGVADEMAHLARRRVTQVVGESPVAPSHDALYIGTEAVLHRVPSADAVVFVDFDQELIAPRYRAAEEAFALLVRAARLVGPRSGGGRILVQTRMPDHPCWSRQPRPTPLIGSPRRRCADPRCASPHRLRGRSCRAPRQSPTSSGCQARHTRPHWTSPDQPTECGACAATTEEPSSMHWTPRSDRQAGCE